MHKKFPHVSTAHRLTERFQFWTKSVRLLMIAQPEQFVETSEELTKEKGIEKGNWVKVNSQRAYIKVKAVVIKRVRPLWIHGRTVHQIGIPLRGGWENIAGSKQFIINGLTPFVNDCNTQTPEYKTFLVNIERA